MTFENIKDQFAKRAPFFETVGLVLDHVGAGIASAKINNRKDITNHLGSLHAGALFTWEKAHPAQLFLVHLLILLTTSVLSQQKPRLIISILHEG